MEVNEKKCDQHKGDFEMKGRPISGFLSGGEVK